MPLSSWWIGSHPDMPAQSMEVTANASQETITVAAGDYYLHDPAATYSYVTALATALATHTQISTVTITLGRDRLVHFAFDVSTAIAFTTTEGRDLIGMTGNLASTTDGDADTVSEFLWVPDRPENPSARVGRNGNPVYDTVVSATGGANSTVVATSFNSREFNDFDVRFIRDAYFDDGTVSNSGGQYRTFYDRVLRRFRRFKIYRNTLHDETDETDVGLSANNQIGPYVLRDRGPLRFVNERELGRVERLRRARVPVIVATDY